MGILDPFREVRVTSQKDKSLCVVYGCRRTRRRLRRTCHTCNTARWRLRHPEKALYKILKCNARRRDKPFTLSFDHFCEIIKDHDMGGKEGHCLSIDRIDPTLGYEDGNIQVITISENVKKFNRFKRTGYGKRILGPDYY